MPVVHLRQLGQRVDGLALLAASQLRRAERAGQAGVALRVARQHDEVAAFRVGLAVLGLAQLEAELGAEHRGHPDLAGGLGEADDAVEAVVVGDGQRLETEPSGFLDELFGMRRTVEEAEVGVAVQLGVRHRTAPPLHLRLERLALA